MAGKREERKKARFHWLVTSWLIVAAVIIVGVGGIILFMNGLYHKEMRKENAQLPQMLESSRDAKWAYAFNGESQTESESELSLIHILWARKKITATLILTVQFGS